MNIALIGYGKMGKAIEQIAVKRGHKISYIIDRENITDLKNINKSNTDIAIEFTQPEAAFNNIYTLISGLIPVVSGSTGWLEKKPEIEKLTIDNKCGFFYASNYSVGVNIFFQLNKILAKLMNGFSDYSIKMEEIHHTEKKDAPSGTAITLAEGIIENINHVKSWINEETTEESELTIISKRIGQVPGTHIIDYTSSVDTIEISHTAHNREGFALGAVLAAEWLIGKTGNYGMEDLLKF